MIEASQTIARSRLPSKSRSRCSTPKHHRSCCRQASRTIDRIDLDPARHIHAADRVTRVEPVSLAGERGSTDQLLLVFGSKLGLALGFVDPLRALDLRVSPGLDRIIDIVDDDLPEPRFHHVLHLPRALASEQSQWPACGAVISRSNSAVVRARSSANRSSTSSLPFRNTGRSRFSRPASCSMRTPS